MSKTKAQLEQENAAQAEQLDVLRELITAIAACADVPIAAAGHHGEDDKLAWKRADTIRAYLHDIDYSEQYLTAILADKAQALREYAARPVPYPVYQPEDGGAS